MHSTATMIRASRALKRARPLTAVSRGGLNPLATKAWWPRAAVAAAGTPAVATFATRGKRAIMDEPEAVGAPRAWWAQMVPFAPKLKANQNDFKRHEKWGQRIAEIIDEKRGEQGGAKVEEGGEVAAADAAADADAAEEVGEVAEVAEATEPEGEEGDEGGDVGEAGEEETGEKDK